MGYLFCIKKPKQQRHTFVKPDGTRGWRTSFLTPYKPHYIDLGSAAMARQGLTGAMPKEQVAEQIARAREFFAIAFPAANAAIATLGLTLVTGEGFSYNMERRVWFRVEGSRRRLKAFLDGHGSHLEDFWSVMGNNYYLERRDPMVFPRFNRPITDYLPYRLNVDTFFGRSFGQSMRDPYFHTFGEFYETSDPEDQRPFMLFRSERDLVVAKLLLA